MSGKDSDTFCSKSPAPPDESKDEVGRPSRLVKPGYVSGKDSDTFFSKPPTPPDVSRDEVGRPRR